MDAEYAYLFRHALVRAAAYELQPPGERAVLHAVALSLIEQVLRQTSGEAALDAAADDLARHAGAARLGATPEQAAYFGLAEIKWLRRAASYAKSMSMQRRRLAFCRAVRAHPDLPADEAHAADLAVATALVDSGQTGEAVAALGELMPVLEASATVEQVLDCQFLLSQALQSKGDVELAEQMATAALARCEQLKLPDLASRFHAVRLRCWRVRGQWDKALAVLPGLVDDAKSRSDTRQLVNIMCLHGAILSDVGRMPEAADILHAARVESEKAGNDYLIAFCKGLEGLTRRDLGDNQAALDPIRQACKFFQEVGDARLESSFLGGLSAALHNLNRFDESRDAAMRSRDLARESGNKREEHAALSLIGSCFVHQGDFAKAAESLALACKLADEMKDNVQSATHKMKLAVARLALGDNADYARLTQEAKAILEAANRPHDFARCLKDQHTLMQTLRLEA